MKVRKLRWRFYRKAGGGRGIGNRCSAYYPGCIVCEMYRYKDQHGGFPTFDEACAICDAIHGNPPREQIAARL
jgi:hypothetical protein